jgi:hypothetical protein
MVLSCYQIRKAHTVLKVKMMNEYQKAVIYDQIDKLNADIRRVNLNIADVQRRDYLNINEKVLIVSTYYEKTQAIKWIINTIEKEIQNE